MQEAKPYSISKKAVIAAYQRVKANKGTYGVDEQSIEDFERKLNNNLYKIWNRMSSGTYFPKPVKAVAIPKKNGGTRILGVPTGYWSLISGGCLITSDMIISWKW